MDLQDQLKNLFPNHVPEQEEEASPEKENAPYRLQQTPIHCMYEKRKGKPVTLLEGYSGLDADFKKLTRDLKAHLNVGGSYKNGVILIQGDYRDMIMDFLKTHGFAVKRVGG